MHPKTKQLLAIAIGLSLSGCAGPDVEPDGDGLPPPGVGPKIRSPDGFGGSAVAPGGNAPSLPQNFTPPEEIAWTGFDGEGIPELENLMAAPKKGPWEESETLARQAAAREGKPILIWFTDSARSPMCKVLNAELFSTAGFGKWADQKLVRLRVDANVTVDDPKLSLDEKITRQTEIRNYVKQLKKRYRVLGQPSVLMLNPSGEVMVRFRGYKRGDSEFFWGLIKQGVASAEAARNEWRQGLEKKGYREWRGTGGRTVFAKLVSYSKGSLILVEPGGVRYRTDESKLSAGDREWINRQKAMRQIE